MWYVYVLLSKKDNEMYVGCTKDLKARYKKHQQGLVTSTKFRKPFLLIYYEACLNKQDAFRREIYLKSGYGHKWLNNRLKLYDDERKVAEGY